MLERQLGHFTGELASLAPFISAFISSLLGVPLLGKPLNCVMTPELIRWGLAQCNHNVMWAYQKNCY
ncbi:hypothetical protein [Moraxella nonliquefaciens]|uniref:Uncharacterized protein n=1 Tax=Moraxella nonliquefaciens TaxID=478 RepID=A0A7T3C2H5_MORNO|nr:hypothetical protein [Moraxella nonliquefaciens]MDI4497605.1 hypothetical protein [Moraxella nonliquefaciens]MDI4499622.1 hypothetical protein [Moraxella nonliquefaciens]QPT45414.1 hypothetical protein I6G26_05410 [Moraxella nonliquefaciens]QQC30447.1 hypothetical protein I6H63_04200 [Moraxella nonliquefaciens]